MGLLYKGYQRQFNQFKLDQRMKEHSLNNSRNDVNKKSTTERSHLKNPPKIHLVNNKKR